MQVHAMRAWGAADSPLGWVGGTVKGTKGRNVDRDLNRRRSMADAVSSRATARPRRQTVGGTVREDAVTARSPASGSNSAWNPPQMGFSPWKESSNVFSSPCGGTGMNHHTPTPADSPICLEPCEQQLGEKKWVTVRDAEWRVAPRSDSEMIGKLSEGRKLSEMPSPRSFPGWCPVSPRGFVSFNDITPLLQSDSGDVASGAGLALQKSDAQRELESLQQTRSEVAAELHRLQEERAAEREKLEQCRQQRGRMEQKLRRCSDIVAFTVNTMDRIHGLSDDDFSCEEDSDKVVHETQADLLIAGFAARQSLCSIAEERDGTEGDDGSWAEEALSGGHQGDANDDSSVEMESDGEAANKENTPPACTAACWPGAVAMPAGKEGIGDGEFCSRHMHVPSPSFFFPAGSPQPASSRLSREPLRRIDTVQQ